MTTILVFDDEARAALSAGRVSHGCALFQPDTVDEVLAAPERSLVDLAIIDVMATDTEGGPLIASLRRRFPSLKILAVGPDGWSDLGGADCAIYRPLADTLTAVVASLLMTDGDHDAAARDIARGDEVTAGDTASHPSATRFQSRLRKASHRW